MVLNRLIGEVYIYSEDIPPEMMVTELFAGDHIAIEVKGIQVRSSIDAPKQLTILRDNANETLQIDCIETNSLTRKCWAFCGCALVN